MNISIISIFRDESKYLKEWIEFHRLIGVDKFHLVNNNSVDDYKKILEVYINSGIVTLYNLNVETKFNKPDFKNEQIIVTHFVQLFQNIVKQSNEDWMIHVSTDEFIFPTEENNIKNVLNKFDNEVGEVSVNWTLFGNNNLYLNDNELLIEKLTKSSFENHIHNYHVKPIFKPEAVSSIPSVHFTSLKPGFVKVDAKGNINNFKTPYEVRDRVFSPLHINHYRLRDLSWTDDKLKIYELWGRKEFLDLKNSYNDIENLNISKYIEPLKKIIFNNK